mmetsp:Transcript_73553/g.213053  ORF Transcript_73553/g.213053 Transcript_73553/m.213053 type:complete len:246 (+) Transcript_73553:633-1370(+)
MPDSNVATRGSPWTGSGPAGQSDVSSRTASRMKSMNSSASNVPPPSSSMARKAIIKFRSGASWWLTSRIFRKKRRISSEPSDPSPPALSMMPSAADRWNRSSSCGNVSRWRWIASRTARLTCVSTISFSRGLISRTRTKDSNSEKPTAPAPWLISRKTSFSSSSETKRSAIFKWPRAIFATWERSSEPVPWLSQAMNNFLKKSVSFCHRSLEDSWPVLFFVAASFSKARTRRVGDFSPPASITVG